MSWLSVDIKGGKKILETAPFLLPRTQQCLRVWEGPRGKDSELLPWCLHTASCVSGLKDQGPDAAGLSSRSSEYTGTFWLNGLDHVHPVKL